MARIVNLTLTGLSSKCDCHPQLDSCPRCPYCGQEDTEPSTHLARVHDKTVGQ